MYSIFHKNIQIWDDLKGSINQFQCVTQFRIKTVLTLDILIWSVLHLTEIDPISTKLL